MPTAGITHDLVIEDASSGSPARGFMLARDKQGLRSNILADYGVIQPRQLTMGELTEAEFPAEIDLVWTQGNWELGAGGVLHRDDPLSLGQTSRIDSSTPNKIILAREVTASALNSAATDDDCSGFAVFPGDPVEAMVGEEEYVWDDGTPDFHIRTNNPMATGQIARNGVQYKGSVYCPVWTAATNVPARFIKKASTGDTWTAGGVAGDTFKYAGVANDLFWAGNWGAAAPNTVKTTLDPSAANITWTTWVVGEASSEITALVPRGDTMLVCKTNGVWVIFPNGRIRNLTPQFESQAHADHFKGAIEWNGHILLPLGTGGLADLIGDETIDVSMKKYAPAITAWHGRVVAMAGDVTRLYILVLETATTSYHLFMADQVEYQQVEDFRWHHLSTIPYVTGSDEEHATLFVDGTIVSSNTHHRLWIGIESTASAVTPYYMALSGDSLADVYTATDGTAYAVRWDGNLPKVNKLFSSIDFETTSMAGTADTAHHAEVEYRVWVSATGWGNWTYVTGAQAASTLIQVSQTLTFADEVVGQAIELRYTMNRGSTTSTTPEINKWTLHAQLRPGAVKVRPLAIYLADGMELLNGGIRSSVRGDLTQLIAWSDGAAEVTIRWKDPRGAQSMDVVFLPGKSKLTEVSHRQHYRSEYIFEALVAQVSQ